jgi:hypothetical protein
MDGAVQQAPQWSRQFTAFSANCGLDRQRRIDGDVGSQGAS